MQTFVFKPATAQLRLADVLVGLGYSGKGEGLNNSEFQHVHNVGPLPAGFYTFRLRSDFSAGLPYGPRAFDLVPDPENDMDGRDKFSFMCHWDNRSHNFSASEGCLVLVTIWTFYMIDDGDRLQVIR